MAKSFSTQNYQAIHPQKFLLWLCMLSICMIFAALTSAYIVKKADIVFLQTIPVIFWHNTLLIIGSSITMQFAYLYIKRNKFYSTLILLIFTLIFAILFLSGQYKSWTILVELGVYFVGNPIGSFLYILTGLHGIHLLSGILFILWVFFAYLFKKWQLKCLFWMELCTTYWHFLGILWVYLFLFMLFNH